MAYNQRAKNRVKLDDYKGAISDFTKAIEIDPKFVRAYVNRGEARIDVHDLQGAILDFNQAIVIDPEMADAYYSRGYTKILLGQKQSGCKDLETAQELGKVETHFLIKEFCKENAPPPKRRW